MTLNWRYYKSSELVLLKSVTVLLLTDSTHLKCPIPPTGSLYQFPALANGSWLNGGDPISSSVFAHRARRSTLHALLFNICYITHCKTACFSFKSTQISKFEYVRASSCQSNSSQWHVYVSPLGYNVVFITCVSGLNMSSCTMTLPTARIAVMSIHGKNIIAGNNQLYFCFRTYVCAASVGIVA